MAESSPSMNTQTLTKDHASPHETHHEQDARAIFGFWIYIMSDCLLFATLFAAYAVLHSNTFGGPPARELFSLPFVLTETFILLTSSFTYGLAMLAAHHNNKQQVIGFLALTFVLGASFIGMELTEFTKLITEGNSFARSGFLSSFFTLVGTHGLHVTVGLLWMGSLIAQISLRGLNTMTFRKLSCLGLFWHFLDIVWIFIFTIIYLMSAAT